MPFRALRSIPIFVTLLSCSSTPHDATVTAADGGADVAQIDSSVAIGAYAGPATEHGTIIEYFSQKPIAGLTVSDNGLTSITDSDGKWSISVPAGVKTLAPTVTGTDYATLLFPESVPTAADVDFGTNAMATLNAYGLEQGGLSNDQTKALVQVVVFLGPSCKSSVGGTLQVLAPSGASVVYFGRSVGLPDTAEGPTPERWRRSPPSRAT